MSNLTNDELKSVTGGADEGAQFLKDGAVHGWLCSHCGKCIEGDALPPVCPNCQASLTGDTVAPC